MEKRGIIEEGITPPETIKVKQAAADAIAEKSGRGCINEPKSGGCSCKNGSSSQKRN